MRWVLVGLAVVLAAVVGLEWLDWPPTLPRPDGDQAPPPSATAGGSQSAKPRAGIAPLEDKEQYAVVMERPLFLPDRRPPAKDPEESEPKKPEVDPDLSKVSLTAVLITPKETTAWVKDPKEKELVRLELGDELHGWAVKQILGDRLILMRQGEQDTLVLRDYKNRPPPPAMRRPQAVPPPQRSHAPYRPGTGSPRTRANGVRFGE